MLKKYLNFVRGVSVNWPGRVGIVLTTSSFIMFVFLEIPTLMGIITNVYVGIITYMILPFLFIVGLILIPIGWWRFRRKSGKSTRELLAARFEGEHLAPSAVGSKLFLIIGSFTVLNIIFLGITSMGAMRFMDQPSFCGTACHTVMNPEWVTYRQSPHARVRCVDCHIGEGFGALVKSKFNGAWQIISTAFNLYQRPIPTPVHQLRPARETCEKCHWPEKFYGSRLKTHVRFGQDERSTPYYTTLNLKIDIGIRVGHSGIHWHIGRENLVRYASVGDEREEMIWVEYQQPDKRITRYTNRRLPPTLAEAEERRTMDCVDCHNRATHIYEYPEQAIDERLEKGLMDITLPFLKRESLSAITTNYPSLEAGMKGIDVHMRKFYEKHYPGAANTKMKAIREAVSILRDIYSRNIHHDMNITWNSYPNHVGHHMDGGCFRCHNSYMKNEAGRHINHDCTLCHSILAYKSKGPFDYLEPGRGEEKEAVMEKYLREEFLNSRQPAKNIEFP
jgi:hypothetical protein